MSVRILKKYYSTVSFPYFITACFANVHLYILPLLGPFGRMGPIGIRFHFYLHNQVKYVNLLFLLRGMTWDVKYFCEHYIIFPDNWTKLIIHFLCLTYKYGFYDWLNWWHLYRFWNLYGFFCMIVFGKKYEWICQIFFNISPANWTMLIIHFPYLNCSWLTVLGKSI